jgi:hypothetical protein
MLKLMYKINRIFNKLNQYFYILPLISILTNIFNNKYLRSINKLIKIIIFINIVLGVSLIVLFTDLNTPINITYSIYSDIIEPYIELLKHLWDQLINYLNIGESAGPVNNKIESVLQESISQIQIEVKEGIKSGIKEALDEVISDIQEAESKIQSEYLIKQIALISSLLFFGYFIFILPGSTISPNELIQYNWVNQSLIELKINLINILFNPVVSSVASSPINPTVELDSNIIRSMVDVGTSPISPISEGSSVGISTITPNSPIQTLSEYVDASTQTELSGIEFSRFVKANQIVGESLPESTQININQFVNKVITKITD